MVRDRQAVRVAIITLALGLLVSLGRWPRHWWSNRTPLAVLAAVGVAVVAAAVLTARPTALRVAAGLCVLDAVLLIRRWSVHLPLHCHCLPRSGAPAILGWGGAALIADVGLAALAVILAQRRHTD